MLKIDFGCCTEENLNHSSHCTDLDSRIDRGQAKSNIVATGRVVTESKQQKVLVKDSGIHRSSIKSNTSADCPQVDLDGGKN